MLLHEIRQRITEDLLARRIDRWVTGTIAALLVALGFMAGRWTSLTNTAVPVVFQEAPGTEGSAVSPEQLKALVEEPPEEQRRPGERPRQSAATVESASTVAPAPAAALRLQGAFVASANGEKYYFPDCTEVRRIKEENKIWFDSAEEARASGYEPSACVQRRGQ